MSNESTEIQKTYEDMVDAVKLKIQADRVDGRKKMETHFQTESVFFEVNAKVESLH